MDCQQKLKVLMFDIIATELINRKNKTDMFD